MPIIKRYPNRKLYDTEAKKYITLHGVAELIRQEEEVHVIDNTTREDLTAVTLTQIILEEERKQSGFLPRSVLAGLIQASGNRLNALQRNLFSSIGFLHVVDEEIKRRINVLISQGDLAEKEGRRILEQLLSFSNISPGNKPPVNEEEIERIIVERNIPAREDMDKLSLQLEALAAKLDQLIDE